MSIDRRIFLQTSAATAAGLVLLPHAFAVPASAPGAAPDKIRFDRECYTVEGRDLLLYGAEFHYPRCPRELWADRFLKLQRAGFNYIQTVVFWNWHERTQGSFDFGDLQAFFKMAGDFGFYASVRPGPYICAEWDRGGFPAWVVAEQFPLRGMDPRNLRWSKYWFDRVLPVLRPLQVTQGGPIVMLQIENEIDYWGEPEEEKERYLVYLAQLAWQNGIEVPLFTNMGRAARDNRNPVMARVADSLDKYPRWNVDAVVGPLEELRRQEPAAPLGMAELQGGWFAKVGGKLSVEQEGVDGAQLALLDRMVLSRGVTWFNDYMGFGGTNFDWAGKDLTTTYDYAAPIREPGGLWEKYYEAHGIGQLLGHSGEVLTRAQAMASPSSADVPQIEVTQRARGERSVLFVRSTGKQEQPFHLTLNTGTARFMVPLSGALRLAPREMKALPVNLPLGPTRLLYTTAELAGFGSIGKRWYVILQERPGRAVEAAFGYEQQPQLRGEVTNASWDARQQALRVLVDSSGDDQTFEIGEELVLVVTSRQRGLRTWRMALNSGPASNPDTLAWITDASLLRQAGEQGKVIWADLDLQPGNHAISVLAPTAPARVTAGGRPVEPAWDAASSLLQMRLVVPPPNVDAIPIQNVQYWVEEIATGPGNWPRAAALADGDLPAIESLGPVPYGWVKYRAHFEAGDGAKLEVHRWAEQGEPHACRVFVNGRLAPVEAAAAAAAGTSAGPHRPPRRGAPQTHLLAGLTNPGVNRIEVIYDCFGALNFGKGMQDLAGLRSVRLVTAAGASERITDWQVQLAPAPMKGREVDPAFVFGGWRTATLGELTQEFGEPLAPAFVWVSAPFRLLAPNPPWHVAWRLHVEADRDCLLYVNGHFVGRYANAGPQKDFYLPEPWLHRDGATNSLTAVIAGGRHPDHLRVLRVESYDEWMVRTTRIELTMP